jgi:hypothetical protein
MIAFCAFDVCSGNQIFGNGTQIARTYAKYHEIPAAQTAVERDR